MNFLGISKLFEKKQNEMRQIMSEHNRLMRAEGLDAVFEDVEEDAKEFAKNAVRLTSETMKEVRSIMEEQGVITTRVKKETCYWVGISPPPGKTVSEFVHACETWTELAFQDKVAMTIEQRGKDPASCGEGMHMHAFIKPTRNDKNGIKNKTLTHFSKLGVKFCFIETVTKGTEDNVVTYMTEHRSKDEHKIVSKEMDELFRYHHNIKEMYFLGDW